MQTALEIAFICVILAGTGMDYFVRLIIHKHVSLLNLGCALTAILGIYLFQKATSRLLPAPIPSPQAETNSFVLDPFKSLLNTADPLLVIRFFAAFIVFTTHIMILLHPTPEVLAGKWQFLSGGAHAGMAIFFTLSGFLMGKAFLSGRYHASRKGILIFYESRWIRIFPLMCFVFLFLCVLQYPSILRFTPLSAFRLFTFNYYGNTLPFNGIGAMWSLSVEMQYYVIAPFIFLLFNRIMTTSPKKGILLLIAVITTLTLLKGWVANQYMILDTPVRNPLLFSLFGNLPFFLIGFLCNYLSFRVPERIAKYIVNCWIIPLEFALAFYLCSFVLAINFTFISIGTGITIILLDGIRHTSAYKDLHRFSMFRILQIFGVLSYGFYLWHSGIGYVHSQLFPHGFSTHSSYLLEALIVASVVLVFSFITFVLVEDRFNAYKPINRFSKPVSNMHL